jgi:hypothetical protein
MAVLLCSYYCLLRLAACCVLYYCCTAGVPMCLLPIAYYDITISMLATTPMILDTSSSSGSGSGTLDRLIAM